MAGLALNMLGVGMAMYSGHAVDWGRAAVLQVVITSLQIVGALANEYSDVETDKVNKNRTYFSGGSGIVASGRIARRSASWLTVFWCTTAIGAAGVLSFSMGANAIVIILTLLGLVGALSYSIGPTKLSYRGFGEVGMAAMVSFLCPLTAYYVQASSFDAFAFFLTVPLIFQMLGLMMVVQYPDYEADMAAMKRNLVVRFGRQRSWWIGICMLSLGGALMPLGLLLKLPSGLLVAISAIMFSEALLFLFLNDRLSSRRSMNWATAAAAGYYMLVILLSAGMLASL